jgi:CRISPR/Cas system-associated exonuclease Cas4 (RecB family)
MIEKTDRFYTIEGNDYPSVTTILDVISKGAGFYKWLLSRTTEEATAVTKDALNVGTTTHNLIDKYSKGEEVDISKEDDRVKACFNNYVTKVIGELGYKHIQSEQTVHSKKYGYAGTLDGIGEVNKKLVLLDVKTSSRIYDTYQLQLEAYRLAYEEMTGKKIKQLYIINLKKNGGVILKQYKPNNKVFKVFLSALEIYKWQRSNKKVGSK